MLRAPLILLLLVTGHKAQRLARPESPYNQCSGWSVCRKNEIMDLVSVSTISTQYLVDICLQCILYLDIYYKRHLNFSTAAFQSEFWADCWQLQPLGPSWWPPAAANNPQQSTILLAAFPNIQTQCLLVCSALLCCSVAWCCEKTGINAQYSVLLWQRCQHWRFFNILCKLNLSSSHVSRSWRLILIGKES